MESGPLFSLCNKRILLGITGGIAAYKSAELCRILLKAGAEVRVVMTPSAIEFIAPLTFQALSGNRVHTDLLDADTEAAMGHIELARWADLIVVAPASANFIARLASGEAPDLLSTLCLASIAPIAIAPSMNQAMLLNEVTQENIKKIKQNKISVLDTGEGAQACGDIGPGRMLEPAEIAELAASFFQLGELAGLNVTITAGPTREAIDPVRFISNRSSGKMGYALARAAMEAGAKVTLISGPVSLIPPPQVTLILVETAAEMFDACQESSADIFIGVAAVADYRPKNIAEGKIKKTTDSLNIELVKTTDILATIAKQSSAKTTRPFCVGFAAETENLEENAQQKLLSKNLDLIFANLAIESFDNDDSTITAYWTGGMHKFGTLNKEQLARAMVSLICERRISE